MTLESQHDSGFGKGIKIAKHLLTVVRSNEDLFFAV